MGGPLAGLTVVEFAGLGPGPFAGMVLADLGARVIRIDRVGAAPGVPGGVDLLARGRTAIRLDLKQPRGRDIALALVERADAVIEGFRPGVLESLGLGPADCTERNPRLVYGRVTGWGQTGPLAHSAGHDITYLALSGTLHALGRAGAAPTPPINLLADFGGGGMLLAVGVLAALLEAQRSGRGQVVDAAMVDGSALLATLIIGLRSAGIWSDERGTNLLDTGAPYYEVYECADGRHVAVGALEPKFYAELVARIGLPEPPAQGDVAGWAQHKDRFAALFRTRPRDEWTALLAGTDACVAPVLTWSEAAEHPHNRERGTFLAPDGVLQPAPAPRFARTPADPPAPPPEPGRDTDEVLASLGLGAPEIAELRAGGAVA